MRLLEPGWVIRTIPGEKYLLAFYENGYTTTGKWRMEDEVLHVLHHGVMYRFRCARDTYYVGLDDKKLRLFVPTTVTANGSNQLTMPPLTTQAWNFAASIAAFVSDGLRLVSQEEYARRLAICEPCKHRRHSRCSKCGCGLTLKAKGRAFKCPIGLWEAPK
jgi:hypothetical protein